MLLGRRQEVERKMNESTETALDMKSIEKSTKYLEEVTWLLLHTQNLLDWLSDSMKSREGVKRISIEFDWLKRIGEQARNHMRTNPAEAARELQNVLISLRNSKFQAFKPIALSKAMDEDAYFLNELSSYLKEPNKIKINVDHFIENALRIKDKSLRNAVLKRLMILKRFFEIVNSIIIISQDLSDWTRYVSMKVSFFPERLEQYFLGVPPFNEKFVGLDKLNEQLLKDRIYLSREIKNMQFLWRATEIVNYLLGDFDNGTWNRTDRIKNFVDNLEVYAKEAEEKYRSPELAQLLRTNTKLLQQPYEWISLLKRSVPDKATTIQNARDFLLREFENRKKEIEKNILILINQFELILNQALIPGQYMRNVNSMLENMEKILLKRWSANEREFRSLSKKLEGSIAVACQAIERASEIALIRTDMDRLVRRLHELTELFESLASRPIVMQSIDNAIEHLLTKDIGLASTGKTAEQIIEAEREINKKAFIVKERINPVKDRMAETLKIIFEFDRWITSARINPGIDKISIFRVRLTPFKGENYGR